MTDVLVAASIAVPLILFFVCLRGWMSAVEESIRLETRLHHTREALREARDFIQAMGEDE